MLGKDLFIKFYCFLIFIKAGNMDVFIVSAAVLKIFDYTSRIQLYGYVGSFIIAGIILYFPSFSFIYIF